MLNDKAKQIFSRQITLPEVGEKGQEELEDTGILIVGMGGLGCPVAHYLVSSGIGYLTLMDPDKVELSNLSRQPLYSEADVGNLKVDAAKKVLANMNPTAVINEVSEELNKDNALTYVSSHDFVIDCTDNVDSRYILSDICQSIDKPLIHGGIRAFEGNTGVFFQVVAIIVHYTLSLLLLNQFKIAQLLEFSVVLSVGLGCIKLC